ncbi:MAG: DUF4214 domain-containing protein [Pseudomonadota bacterium]
MTDLADDFSTNINTTGKLVVGTPSHGSFERDGDSDWFAVSLSAGTNYMFSLAPDGYGFYANVSLAMYDANGTRIGPISTGIGGMPTIIEFTAPATATYYFGVASPLMHQSYTVSAAARTAPDDYSANSATSALLVAGAAVMGNTEVYGDHDWIRFHTEANGHYIFGGTTTSAQAGGVSGTPNFVLRDASGAPVNATLNAITAFEPGVAADYFLDVSNVSVLSYSITATSLVDDYSANNLSTGRLQAGDQTSGIIERNRDVDRFQVTLDAHYFYTFTMAGVGASEVFELTLRNAAGDALSSANGLYTPDGTSIVYRPASSGVYYVDAALFGGFTLEQTYPKPYTLTASGPVADDYGDTRASAMSMMPGTSIDGSLQNYSDIDMVALSLVRGTTYAFQLSGRGTRWSPDLTITDGAGKLLLTSANSVHDVYTFTPLASGTYYAAASGATGDYSLAVSAALDDFGADTNTAGSLTVGSSVTGTLEAGGGDRDWFSVSLAAGSTYWFTASSDVSSQLKYGGGMLRLLNASGKEVATMSGAKGNGIVDTMPYAVTASGTYYLEISSPNRYPGDYVLSAVVGERDDFGGTPLTATVLDTTKAIHGKLELLTDKDVFKLIVIAGNVYGIDVQAANGEFYSLEYVDSSGKPVSGYVGSAAYPSTLQLFQARETGDVYLSLAPMFKGGISYAMSAVSYGPDDYANDNATTATLPMGGSLSGTISYPSDVDTMHVRLEAGKTYAFELLGAFSGNGSMKTASGSNLSIDSSGVTLIGSGAEPRMLVTPASSGDYTLRVSGGNTNNVGSYVVKALTLSGDTVGPTVLGQSHPQGAREVALTDTTITFKFNEPIAIDRTAIVLKDANGHVIPFSYFQGGGYPVVNDDTLTITTQSFFSPGSYTLSMPHAAIHDLAGNQHGAPETLSFTTVLPNDTPSAGNDLIMGNKSVTIDGGAGIDTVLYGGSYYNYHIVRAGGAVSVSASGQDTLHDTLVNVERLIFDQQAYALDIDGNGGQAYRLYQAAFNRTPDLAGLGFWIKQIDHGLSLHDAANYFVESSEFKTLYGGAQSNEDFLTHMYANVFHRLPDSGGEAFWLDAMARGFSRADVLANFSESPENQAALIGVIGNGFQYTPA